MMPWAFCPCMTNKLSPYAYYERNAEVSDYWHNYCLGMWHEPFPTKPLSGLKKNLPHSNGHYSASHPSTYICLLFLSLTFLKHAFHIILQSQLLFFLWTRVAYGNSFSKTGKSWRVNAYTVKKITYFSTDKIIWYSPSSKIFL